MDYNLLKYIITVDKHQSISKAAEELYLENKNMVVVIPTVATVENTLKNLLKGYQRRWKRP